uniref:Sodium/calcium exchanger membrane region domain-containing protein n=1 Tax=Fagus sylvatica TaxID=28930 RepID=A0A2N9GR64_FAGSY
MSNHHLTFSSLPFLPNSSVAPPYGFHHLTVHCRRPPPYHHQSDLISDGVHDRYFVLDGLSAESSTCDQTYGFLPCTTTVIGNIFLIAVYGYLMFMAASYLSRGSELLLQILGPGIIGGLFLPILGALPDALLILVSGLSGTTETAQSQVSIGMGLLAGSTVMLLTVLWGSCVIVGKCDLVDTVAQDATDTKGFSLTESGVSTDIWTSYAARMMVISVIPFLIVQIPQLLNSTSGEALSSLDWAYCLSSTIGFLLPLSVAGNISMVLLNALEMFLREINRGDDKEQAFGYGRRNFGKENQEASKFWDDNGPSAFDPKEKNLLCEAEACYIRTSSKGYRKRWTGNAAAEGCLMQLTQIVMDYISATELRAFIVGIQFEEIDLHHNDVMAKEDKADCWSLLIDKPIKNKKRGGSVVREWLTEQNRRVREQEDLLDVGVQSDEVVEGGESSKWTSIKAVLLLFLGTIIAAAFADPLVDAVDNFSDATSIPAFFISFIVLPLATNSSEAVSAIIFASRSKRTTASLTFSEIYGAATMNNLLCLAVFLALIYIRDLTWDFSAEVLVILIVCIVMGLFASFRTHFPLWTSIVAILLYPFSLVLIYVLDYVFGWS